MLEAGIKAVDAWRAFMQMKGSKRDLFLAQAAYNTATAEQIMSEPWRGETEGGPTTEYLLKLADHHKRLAEEATS